MNDSIIVHGTFVAYYIVMVGIGVYAWYRTASLSDYILGGRRLGVWVTALSAEATAMSGWLFLGLPGFAYAQGTIALWMAGGLLLGTYLNWKLVARRLREATAGLGDALTIPVYLERRFQDNSGILRLAGAVFLIVFFTAYTAAGLAGCGKLFEAVFGWNYQWSVVLGAVLIVTYTFLGGFMAVSWTDLVQGSLMWIAIVTVAIGGVILLGGPDGVARSLAVDNPDKLAWFSWAGGEPLGWVGIVSLVGWGLGYFGQPHVMARFMAIRDPRWIPTTLRIAMGWIIAAMLAAVLVGLVGVGLVTPPLTGADTEKVFIRLVMDLLPPLLTGICLAGLLAAIMSTADSQLLVASSACVEDIYGRLKHRPLSQRQLMILGRGVVCFIALVAMWAALDPRSRVLELVAYAWAGLGATFGPVVLLSLYWRRMSRVGAIAGILTGGLTVIIWANLEGGWFDLYELVPAFTLACLAIVLFTLLAPDQVNPSMGGEGE